MSTLLDEAIDAVKRLPVSAQDEIARAILRLSGQADPEVATLSADERAAIDRSKDAAARGDFASEDEVARVWAKHEL